METSVLLFAIRYTTFHSLVVARIARTAGPDPPMQSVAPNPAAGQELLVIEVPTVVVIVIEEHLVPTMLEAILIVGGAGLNRVGGNRMLRKRMRPNLSRGVGNSAAAITVSA